MLGSSLLGSIMLTPSHILVDLATLLEKGVVGDGVLFFSIRPLGDGCGDKADCRIVGGGVGTLGGVRFGGVGLHVEGDEIGILGDATRVGGN